MSSKWLSYNDIKFGLKRKLYELKHNARGKKLIYNARNGDYVGHVDESKQSFSQEPKYSVSKLEIDIFGNRSDENFRQSLYGDSDNYEL